MDFFGILYDMKNGKKVPYSKTYFDTLFAAKLAEMQIKTLTGTLPLTFRTSETALRSWTIYGNNYEHKYSTSGTLPLTFTTQTAGNADDWSISGNDSIGKNLLNIESATVFPHTTIGSVNNSTGSIEVTAESGYTYRGTSVIITNLLEIGKTYEITLTKNNATPSEQLADATLRRVDTNTIVASVGTAGFAAAGDKTFSYTHTQERAEQGIYFSLLVTGACTTGGTVSVSNLMIREQGTSAEFEPYQVGVGQRTGNLFDKNATDTNNGYVNGKYIRSDESTVSNDNFAISEYIPINANQAYFYKWVDAETIDAPRPAIVFYDSNKGYISGEAFNNRGYFSFVSPQNATFVRLSVQKAGINTVTILCEGSTAPTTFIPYGYEVPLSVNNTTQDIYIGDSPLTAGQSVSKTSTGVDIAAIAGTNTISTDLYNKPEMAITGVDYVGVGEYVNGQWQIPLTVSHYTDNIFDKDAKNTNKGYEDGICLMWTGNIPYPSLTGNEDNNCFVSEKIPASPNTRYYLSDGIFKNTDNGIYSVFLWNRYRMSDYQAFPTEKTFVTGDDTKFIQLCVLKAYADTVMITTKPTETYIPHVEINNVNVPIDAPLTEDQSVTDTQTISTFTGENTIDTTLTNKPNMSITYKGG